MTSSVTAQGVLEGRASPDGALVLSIIGTLDTTSTGQAWRTALRLLHQHQPKRLIVDASRLTYCDGAGAALLIELRRRQESRRIPAEFPFQLIPGLSREMVQRLSEVRPETLGQAGRIPGVTPAAVAVVAAYIDRDPPSSSL